VLLEDLVEALFAEGQNGAEVSLGCSSDEVPNLNIGVEPTHIFNASLPSTVANSGVSTLKKSSVVRMTFLFPRRLA
jgi:hypothetical protein